MPAGDVRTAPATPTLRLVVAGSCAQAQIEVVAGYDNPNRQLDRDFENAVMQAIVE
jgi:hypothetical protein